ATLAATAQRLIVKRGRPMTLRRAQPVQRRDAAKPWQGYEVTPTETPVACVIVPGSARDGETYASGELRRIGDQMAYLAAPDVAGSIGPGDELIDGNTAYAVKEATFYGPGITGILWEPWLRR